MSQNSEFLPSCNYDFFVELREKSQYRDKNSQLPYFNVFSYLVIYLLSCGRYRLPGY